MNSCNHVIIVVILITVQCLQSPPKVFAYGLPQGDRMSLTACRKEAQTSFPLQNTGPYHLGGTTLANCLAASRD